MPDVEKKQRAANETLDEIRAEDKKKKRKAAITGDKKFSKGGNASRKSRAERVEESLKALAEADDELDFVSLGNAAVASPFTSRKTSVRCCRDILQQGRCALVTMLQIYKILGVNCLVTALVLTALHQAGVKQ